MTLGLPFDVKFYGEPLNEVTVSSNGAVNFSGDWIDFWHNPIPTPFNPRKMAAALWDDLNPFAGGRICVDIQGTAPNRIFIVEWKDVPHYWDIGAVTFEMLFYEGSSKVKMQYQDVIFGDTAYDRGASATIGTQADDIMGTQYSYNSASLSDGQAILFFPAPTFFVITNGSELHSGDTLDVSLAAENAADPIELDIHLTLEGPPPIGGPIPFINVPGVLLPGNFAVEVPFFSVTFPPTVPAGTYAFRAWLNKSNSPNVLSDELTTFTFTP